MSTKYQRFIIVYQESKTKEEKSQNVSTKWQMLLFAIEDSGIIQSDSYSSESVIEWRWLYRTTDF